MQQQQQSYEVKLYCQLSNSIISEWVVRVGIRDLNSKIIEIFHNFLILALGYLTVGLGQILECIDIDHTFSYRLDDKKLHSGCPQKNCPVAFMLISHLNLHIQRSSRTVWKSIRFNTLCNCNAKILFLIMTPGVFNLIYLKFYRVKMQKQGQF